MTGEDTVYNDLENIEGSGGGYYIPWVNNFVATDGDSRPLWVVLLGAYLV